MKTDKVTLGAVENVSFPDLGIKNIPAKIDTGAQSGALHCTKIKKLKDGRKTQLVFSPFNHPNKEITVDKYTIRVVKSSNGQRQKRYFITTKVIVKGKKYKVVMSLADRSEMKVPALIGERFLKKNNFLVDVNQ